ncbi:MAG TPA: hypothetical protein VFB41_02975 [Solirubrobacteraceae bacterium]|nr:hypothetical protein [Solirubrobacteraceae bacterium]
MAKILICEPVVETRELLERLVNRMGHVIVGIDDLESVDVLVFEPGSYAGQAIARRVLEACPDASLVACSAEPLSPAQVTMPRLVATLLQPFSPEDLSRALLACTTNKPYGDAAAHGA